MRFVAAGDREAIVLREELIGRAMDTGAAELMTANLWLWEVEQADPKPQVIVSALLSHSGLPGRALLEPNVSSGPWVRLSPEAAHAAAVRLLSAGASMEVAAFADDGEAAMGFADRVFAWVGRPVTSFASMEHRPDGSAAGFGVFHVPHWVDEGLVLIGPERVGMLWFVGTD
ncbi:hypothetical protein J0H58_35780 [bacterium]|nr:hypothetical protein [bacterium]